jgi:hypothetical protein
LSLASRAGRTQARGCWHPATGRRGPRQSFQGEGESSAGQAPKNTSQAFPVERSFDVTGRKGRGKGSLSEALQALVGGDHGRGLIKSSTFSTPNSIAGLLGKRLAIAPDADGRISSAGVFNSVVSNEPVEVKLLYKDTHPLS